MKEGILLYVTQGKTVDEQQLARFIEINGLQGVPIVISSQAEGSLTFYEAYKKLASKGADIVECFSAKVNNKGDLELLKSNITLPAGIDLLKFCSPEELGLGEGEEDKTPESHV
ncbi:MAG: hypothetical protein JRJ48_03180 [Deltaproteobacteria bacterium]|nr:hypothetical protein [Deltaproteobacteria bacterium]